MPPLPTVSHLIQTGACATSVLLTNSSPSTSECSVSGSGRPEFAAFQTASHAPLQGLLILDENVATTGGNRSSRGSTPSALSSPLPLAPESSGWPSRISGSPPMSSSERFPPAVSPRNGGNVGALPTFGIVRSPTAAGATGTPACTNAQLCDPQWWQQFQEEHLNIANTAQLARETLQPPEEAVRQSSSSNMDDDISKKRERIKEMEKTAQVELARLAATRQAEARIISSLEATQALISAARRAD